MIILYYKGGPCSGKTTAFQIVKDYLERHNYHVYMVPEAATMLFINGVAFSDLNSDEGKYAMQQSVLRYFFIFYLFIYFKRDL